jgi:hypothetical protein
MLLMDWVGIGLYAYAVVQSSLGFVRTFPTYRIYFGIAACILGFHITAAVHLVNAMKTLKFHNAASRATSKMSLVKSKHRGSKQGKSVVGQSQSPIPQVKPIAVSDIV